MDENLTEIGRIVAERAQEIFEACGYLNDYCIQHVGGTNAVFGSTNRLIWTVAGGFQLDPGHCVTDFIMNFGMLGKVR